MADFGIWQVHLSSIPLKMICKVVSRGQPDSLYGAVDVDVDKEVDKEMDEGLQMFISPAFLSK